MIQQQSDKAGSPEELEDRNLDQVAGGVASSPAYDANLPPPNDPSTSQKKMMGSPKIGENG